MVLLQANPGQANFGKEAEIAGSAQCRTGHTHSNAGTPASPFIARRGRCHLHATPSHPTHSCVSVVRLTPVYGIARTLLARADILYAQADDLRDTMERNVASMAATSETYVAAGC
jgi:hypothetical protein